MQLLLGALVKKGHAHYSCWRHFESRVAYSHITAAHRGPFEGRVLNYDVVRKILYERIINFSPKVSNIYVRNTLRRAPITRGVRQVLCLHFLTETTV